MKICVIGAGASGLTAIKAFAEENVDVVCYEKSEVLGGLWAYNENDLTVTTVARSTIINSSKEMSAFSDYSPPAEFPNYMHNTLMLKYFNMYADNFDLHSTGEIFDSVMLCTGHHGKPNFPKFKNQDQFQGKISHVHTYKKTDGFENQRCCVVGIGNSGGDLAAELSTVTNKVFLSTRRGSWIIPRMASDGLPTDTIMTRRILDLLFTYTPNLMTSMFETLIDKYQYIPSLRHPHTLAIIGLIQPYGPLIPISELQTRWHLQLMKQKCRPLPSIDIMLKDISKKNNNLKNRYYQSNRHTMQVDVVSFMDEVSEQFGAKPDLVKLLYNDPMIWWRCIFGPSLP